MITPHQLGPVVFERRSSSSDLRTMLIASGIAFCLSIFVGVTALLPEPPGQPPARDELDQAGMLATSAVMLCASIAVLIGYLYSSRCAVRLHELGIVRVSPLRELELPFALLDSFSFRRQPNHKQGVLDSVTYFLQFDPAPRSGYRAFYWSVQRVPPDDSRFEQIQEQISNIVTTKMAEELSTCGSVAWTPQMQIRHDGIAYQGLSAWRILPWEEFGQPLLSSEVFKLHGNRGGPPLVEVNPAQANFYPGLILAVARFREFRAAQKPPPQSISQI